MSKGALGKSIAGSCRPFLLLFAGLVASTYGCGLIEPISHLANNFATIDQGYYRGEQYLPLRVSGPSVVVIDDQPDAELLVERRGSEEVIYSVSETALAKISGTDFDKYLVLVAVGGYDTERDAVIDIKRIRETDGDLYLESRFRAASEKRLLEPSTSFHALKLKRDRFSQGVKYNLHLLDEAGSELSAASAVVNYVGGARPVRAPFTLVASGSGGSSSAALKEPRIIVISNLSQARDFIAANEVPVFSEEVYRFIPPQDARRLSNISYEKNLAVVMMFGGGRRVFPIAAYRTDSNLAFKCLFSSGGFINPPVGSMFEIDIVQRQDVPRGIPFILSLLDQSNVDRSSVSIGKP